jgi:hypothetical protein
VDAKEAVMPTPKLDLSSRKLSRSIACGLAGLAALLGLPAASAFGKAKTAQVDETAPVLCEGQVFSQPFAAFEDLRYYTLAPGGEFNGASEGWTLSAGAQLIKTTRPDGTTGGALYLPAGATATSPPICVTLAYPVARVWLNGTQESKGVNVAVSYAGTKSELEPKATNKVRSNHGTWVLGEFNVSPTLGGKEEAPREVRFIFEGRRNSDSQLFDVYVDPRMH